MNDENVKWSIEDMIEVRLKEDDDFLKVKETLTRIGIASRREKKLFQSCHILHKQGKYYIVHFKELFALHAEGKIKPFVVKTYPLEKTGYAIQLLAKREAIGKIAIKIRD